MEFTDKDIEKRAQEIASKCRHYLITQLGRLPDKAHTAEIFQALSLALRETIMVNWSASVRSINEKKSRRIYYFSLEYLPGRMLSNNISNLHAHNLMKRVAHLCNFDYRSILTWEPDPGLGNGGLGRLASCLLESMATHNYPVCAYGLRYHYGIFEQQLWRGKQVESPDCWLLYNSPWALRRDGSAQTIKFAGKCHEKINKGGEHYHDLEEYEMVRSLAYDYPVIGYAKDEHFTIATLRLWSTKESPRNFQLQRFNAGHMGPAGENTCLTDVLYPNDDNELGKRIRLKQEFLLVSASLQDIIQRHKQIYYQMENFEDKVRIQINDTHPALVVAELIRLLIKHDDYTFDRALEVTEKVVSYTNHTIMPEALEEWNQKRMASLLPRQHAIIEKLNQKFLAKTKVAFPEAPLDKLSLLHGDQIRMANLAILGSHKVNGVAKLHGSIIKEHTFKEFAKLYPDKFTYVTNGVTQRRWLLHANPLLANYISELIGEKWKWDFSEMSKLKEFAKESAVQKRILQIKYQNKERLIGYILAEERPRDLTGKQTKITVDLDPEALFDVQVKRMHEYKRQLMNALHLVMLYHDLLEDIESRKSKRVSLFGGKAAAGYMVAKYVIQFINMLARRVNQDERIKDKLKILFIENYSVSKAELIIPAAELSEQLSTAGREASGTGNMKFAINGALTIGTEDGANIEMKAACEQKHWPFSFGATAQEIASLTNYDPKKIYESNPKIKAAVDLLQGDSLAENESEQEALDALFRSLLEEDRYFVLHDLQSYYETQKRVESYYEDKESWAESVIHNMGAMGHFSSDRAAHEYAKEIWDVGPCPIDPMIYKEVEEAYKSALT